MPDTLLFKLMETQMKRKIDFIVLFIIIFLIILGFIGSRMPKTPDEIPEREKYPVIQLQNNSTKSVPQGVKNTIPGKRVPQQNQ